MDGRGGMGSVERSSSVVDQKMHDCEFFHDLWKST